MYPFPLFFPLLESYKGKFLLFSFHCLIHSYNLIQEFSRIPLSLRMSSASLRTLWSDGLTCSTTAYGTASRRTPRWSGSACGKKKGSAGFCLQITGSDIRTRCSASWTAGKADSRPPKYTGPGIVCRIVQARGGQTVFGNGAQGGSFCEMRFRKRRKKVSYRDRDNTSLQHYTID